MSLKQEIPDKKQLYDALNREIDALNNPSMSAPAHICQILSALKSKFGLFWVGIYEQKGEKLVLSIFQGVVACQEISPGSGACGTAAQKQVTVNIHDVFEHDNYIACHPETRSEIVIPAIRNGKTLFVLDVDSATPGFFNETDEKGLQRVVQYILETGYW